MGDFELRWRPQRPSLGNFQLRLDPSIHAEIRALANGPPSLRLRNAFLRPNWLTLRQEQLNQALRLPPPPSSSSGPSWSPAAGPATPRAGTVGDLLGAIWAVPEIRGTANRALDEAGSTVRRIWNTSSPAERGLLIGHTALLSGGVLAGILSNSDARQQVFELVIDKNIPVPGVDGLTVQLRRRGAGASLSNIAGSGVSVRGGGGVSPTGQPQVDVMINVDLRRWLP